MKSKTLTYNTDTFSMLDNIHSIRRYEQSFLNGDIDIEEFGEKVQKQISMILKSRNKTPIGAICYLLKLKLEINPSVRHAEIDPILDEWIKSSHNQWGRLLHSIRKILGDCSDLEILDFLLYRKLQMNVNVKPINSMDDSVLRLSRGHSVHSRKENIKMKNRIQDKDGITRLDTINYGAFSATKLFRNKR